MAKKEPKRIRKSSTRVYGFFIFIGLFNLILGLIKAKSLFNEYDNSLLIEMISNSTVGILNLICPFLISKRNLLIFLVFGVIFLLEQLYGPLMGKGLDLRMFVAISAVFIWLFFRMDGLFD
ncbi:MAG: hypothetical protein ABFS17_12785 [Chloroflexota bacterium]